MYLHDNKVSSNTKFAINAKNLSESFQTAYLGNLGDRNNEETNPN